MINEMARECDKRTAATQVGISHVTVGAKRCVAIWLIVPGCLMPFTLEIPFRI